SSPVAALKPGASAVIRPAAAPPLKSMTGMVTSAHGRDDALARDRQIAHAHAQRMRDGVADRRRGWAVRRLAGAERAFLRSSDDLDFDRGHLGKAQDRVALPAVAGNAGAIEAHRLEQGPARRLDGATLDLIGDPVRVDHLADVDRGHQATHPDVIEAFDFR